MINQEINRILNSKICDSIAVTVHKNNQELKQLQTILQKKNSEVLDLQNKLMSELSYFEKIVKENQSQQTIIKLTRNFLNTITNDISNLKKYLIEQIKQKFLQYFQNGINQTIKFMQYQQRSKNQKNIKSPKLVSFDSINSHSHNQQINDFEQKIQILNNKIEELQVELNNQKFKTVELTKMNNQLKKQQLSKIFHKKSLKDIQNNSCNTIQNSRQTLILDYQSPSKISDLISPQNQNLSKKKSGLYQYNFPYCFEFQKLKEIQFQGMKVNGKKQGKGFIVYDNNYTYQGSFVADMRQGYGILRLGNIEIYSGDWENNLFHGKGRLSSFIASKKYKNWKYYLGNFKQGCISGTGTIIFQNNERFIAKFNDGNINSNLGVMYENKQNNIQYGSYNNGVFTTTFV